MKKKYVQPAMAVEEMAAELPVCDSVKDMPVFDSTNGMIENESGFLGKERSAGEGGGW